MKSVKGLVEETTGKCQDNGMQVDLSNVNGEEGQSLEKCKAASRSLRPLKLFSMGQKGYLYKKILLKNGTTNDGGRSQSLPNCLDQNDLNENFHDKDNCDSNTEVVAEVKNNVNNSTTCDLWFNTWPERYDKLRSVESSPDDSIASESNKSANTRCVGDETDGTARIFTNKHTVSLNEALQHISLAYSPVTKQLHLVNNTSETHTNGDKYGETEIDNVANKVKHAPCDNNDSSNFSESSELKKSNHRRTQAGSFSSTVSTLSDPSTCGSLLDADERSLGGFDETGPRERKRSITDFFNRNLFAWKTVPNTSNGSRVWKFFSKSSGSSTSSSPQHQVIASSSALIQHPRPSNLPAKTLEEEQRHREEYAAIIAAAKKKEQHNTLVKQKLQKMQLQQEEQQTVATKYFTHHVFPNWDSMSSHKKTRDLWWQGLPSSVRGKVWRLAIGNELNVTPQLYEICMSRAQNRLNSPAPSHHALEVDQESSMDVIQLDISRTFPHLCIFQEGGPYSNILHSMLAAYVCYRPDVGYVQGMSYIAAILILNMEAYDAFTCFANLLNQPLHLSAFTLNQDQMQAYYDAYNDVFSYNLPKLHSHFRKSGLTPDLYLLDWIYTIFAKAMPLDVACRVWDIFLRDGYEFIFRTALGILHLNQDILLEMDFLHGAQFLTHLPDDLSSDQLFKSIQTVTTTIGKQSFSRIVDMYSVSMSNLSS